MTTTTEQLTEQLAAELWATDEAAEYTEWPDLPDHLQRPWLRQAEALAPFVHGLLADARTDGFRQGFQAGRTLNRERRMS